MEDKIKSIMRKIIREAKNYDDETITFYASFAFELWVGILVHVPKETGEVLLRKFVEDVKKEAAEIEMTAANYHLQ